MIPGWIEFTRMLYPCSQQCSATDLVMWVTAALAALYATRLPCARTPVIDERLMIEPPRAPFCFSRATAALQPRNTPTTSISNSCRNAARLTSSIEPSVVMPALFTSTSSGPASAIAASQLSSRVTSSVRNRPAAPSSAARAVPAAVSISATITCAPSATKARAIAAPRPEAPPVIRQRLPASRAAMTCLSHGAIAPLSAPISAPSRTRPLAIVRGAAHAHREDDVRQPRGTSHPPYMGAV